MKERTLFIFAMSATSIVAFCQTSTSTAEAGKSVGDTLLNILIVIGVLWMVGHMIYELFIKKNPFTPIDIQEMQEQRSAFGQSIDMPEDEARQCLSLLEQEFEQWTPIPNDPKESRVITSKKQLDHAEGTILQIRELRPTNPELIGEINGYITAMAECRKRQFTGSKVIMVFLALLCLFLFFAIGWRSLPFFLVSGAVYYMASLTPNFMLYRKELKGKNGVGALGWVLSILGSMILGAQTIRTTTLWSDGTKTTDDDYSQHQAAWAISLVVTVVILFFLLLWAAINYLRNYVFYR